MFELEFFTCGELDNFTCEELEMDVDQLLDKMRSNNASLPISVIDKLEYLCQNLQQDVVLKTETNKTHLTIAQAATIIGTILAYFDTLPDLSEKYKDIVTIIIEVLTEIKSLF